MTYDISIHAPREGSDGLHHPHVHGSVISIHAPREGSDEANKIYEVSICEFLSTLPARGATQAD